MSSIQAMSRSCRASQVVSAATHSRRFIYASSARRAITNMQMPAMSPTMTEGGIASWKKKEGESFAQGDVLLEIETDKATIDVEAQDDGVLGKILAPDGSKGIPVGKIIALLAEEGDDISNLETPKEDPATLSKAAEKTTSASVPSEQPQANSTSPSFQVPQGPEPSFHAPPDHSRPLFPSVHRLLLENNITKTDGIKGTGVRGMLTKGDVLAFLGKASNPLGTFKPSLTPIEEANQSRGKAQTQPPPAAAPPPLDGPAIRRLIVSTMLQTSMKARNQIPTGIKNADFDSIIADYLPTTPKSSIPDTTVIPPSAPKSAKYLDGLY